MKALSLSGLSVAIGALAALASAGAGAQSLPPVLTNPGSGSLFPTPMPSQPSSPGGMFHGMPGVHHGHRSTVFIVERDYVPVVVDEVVEQPAAPPPAPPPPKERRKPYVIGRTYASLPGTCMKLIQPGGAYYHCSDGWYRQVGAQYKAVAQP